MLVVGLVGGGAPLQEPLAARRGAPSGRWRSRSGPRDRPRCRATDRPRAPPADQDRSCRARGGSGSRPACGARARRACARGPDPRTTRRCSRRGAGSGRGRRRACGGTRCSSPARSAGRRRPRDEGVGPPAFAAGAVRVRPIRAHLAAGAEAIPVPARRLEVVDLDVDRVRERRSSPTRRLAERRAPCARRSPLPTRRAPPPAASRRPASRARAPGGSRARRPSARDSPRPRPG